jgi:hypothetical protein
MDLDFRLVDNSAQFVGQLKFAFNVAAGNSVDAGNVRKDHLAVIESGYTDMKPVKVREPDWIQLYSEEGTFGPPVYAQQFSLVVVQCRKNQQFQIA